MEIGEYSTNVLSNNQFSTIHYALYINSTSATVDADILSHVEKLWRNDGSLVTRSPNDEGLLVFGTQATIDGCPESKDTAINSDVHIRMTKRERSSYEPSTFFKALKPGISGLPPSSTINATVFHTQDTTSKNLHAQNLRATQVNGAQPLTLVSEADDANEADTSAKRTARLELTDRITHELFTTAIIEGLMFKFCEVPGNFPLNGRTLVVRRPYTETSDNEGFSMSDRLLIATLDVQMTAQSTLVVKVSTRKASGLGCFGGGSEICKLLNVTASRFWVFLAPIDRIGCCLGIETIEPEFSSELETPSQQFSKHKSVLRWKESCTEWLVGKGIDAGLLKCCVWVNVQMIKAGDSMDSGMIWGGSRFTIQWPAPLCFFQKQLSKGTGNQFKLLENYDPLDFAESWHKAKSERDAAVSQRLKEREVARATEAAKIETVFKTALSNQTQPLRRNSLIGNIYPTPPDGIQQVVGATPSFDGSTLTPGPTHIQAPLDTLESAAPALDADELAGVNWGTAEADKDAEVPASDYQDQSTDNLFGEMDGDLFGEDHDVTDADFSFFDEPDAPVPKVETLPPAVTRTAIEGTTLDAFSGELDDSVDHRHTDAENVCQQLRMQAINTAPEINIFTNEIVEPPLRATTPPLNPEMVFKKLSAMALGNSKLKKLDTSAFGGLAFNPSLPSFTSKYGSRGRFVSPMMPRYTARILRSTLPETEYMNKRQKRKSVVSEHLTLATCSIASPSHLPKIRRGSTSSDADSDDSLSEPNRSDSDDAADSGNNAGIPMSPSKKRKHEVDEDDKEESISVSIHDFASDTAVDVNENWDIADTTSVLQSDPAGWSLDKYFRLGKSEGRIVPFEDAEYIAIAQTLAEQAISSIFDVKGLLVVEDGTCVAAEEREALEVARQALMATAEAFLDKTLECSLSAYLDVQDGANVGQHRPATRPIQNAARLGTHPDPPRSIFPLNAPHLEVSRADSKLTLIPSAVPFWENLGLGPARGTKDVSAVCIHPRALGLFSHVRDFLDHVGSSYESGHLGSHERFSTAEFAYDLTPSSSLDPSSLQSADQLTAPTFPSFQEINIRLGLELTSTTVTERNFVVYYIYDPATPEVLVHICSAFHNLFELYRASFIKSQTPISNDLVLQLIPMSFIASTKSLVVPTPSQYASLALEVYDRCVDLKTRTSPPAIMLERSLPRMIDFKLSPNPSASVMQENSVIHVAYAQSVDNRWVTAAWTDNTGATQFTAAYSLGRQYKAGQPLTNISAIAAEIWDTTKGITSSRRVNWRIMIAKCGVMDPTEVEFWKGLAAVDGSSTTNVTLITVETRPSLQLIPPSTSVLPVSHAIQPASITTPVGTPSAGILSPEQSTNNALTPVDTLQPAVSTPIQEVSDAPPGLDSLLIDIREQSWGTILSHRLNNSESLLDFNPALVSGYLIKRSGTAASDAPVLMEVNILYSEVNPRLYEALLREVLAAYRALGTLGRVRGRYGQDDVRPWHVSAAERGADVLGILL